MKHADLLDRVVDVALGLGEASSWESVRLHQVAAELGLTLEDIRSVVREKEDIVDAWFDRADQAMLAVSQRPEFRDSDATSRLVSLIMAWLDALQPFRRATRQMIIGKLEPGHLHYQLQGALRVSRTVQWIREAAERDHTLPERAVDEAVLTSIYLATFARWMYDSSQASRVTRRFLERKLATAHRVRGWLPGHRQARARPASSAA
ncbi:MAG: TetR/AcrR family transcriptional regulator [Gammaproteobacteria bacterium]|nr:TetR/AcrR family transcriptional regulator [Gammaproteobacteria bacterium]